MHKRYEIKSAKLGSIANVLARHTTGPGEAAAICIMLFVKLWSLFKPDASLEEMAETARSMVLSYNEDTLQ